MSLYFIIEKREDIVKKIDEFLDYVCVNCFCCNRCWHYSVTYKRKVCKALILTLSGGQLNGLKRVDSTCQNLFIIIFKVSKKWQVLLN